MRLLLRVWALPWTLVGLALAPFFSSRRIDAGVLVCEGAAWPRKLGWRYKAITFGHVVLCVDELDEVTLAHELVHVRQYERWGPLFIPAYIVAAGTAASAGGHYYRDNRFEVEARRAEAGMLALISPSEGSGEADR